MPFLQRFSNPKNYFFFFWHQILRCKTTPVLNCLSIACTFLHWSYSVWWSGIAILISSCTFLLIALLCVMARNSQNSSYRMKMPSEIIKMNLTLYSILHVLYVLKMEKRRHEQYFEWQKQKWTTLFEEWI